MKKIITLARHGNTFESHQIPIQIGLRHDLPLTTKGFMQAEALGKFFSGKKIDVIYHGSLQRQQDTAKTIANNHSEPVPLKFSDDLDEIDYGLWEGLTQENIIKYWPESYKKWEENFIWPEDIFNTDYLKLLSNLKSWLKQIDQSPEQNIFAVTSQGVLKLFLHLIPDLFLKIQQECSGKDYKVKTGAFCQFELDENQKFNLLAWNQLPDLT